MKVGEKRIRNTTGSNHRRIKPSPRSLPLSYRGRCICETLSTVVVLPLPAVDFQRWRCWVNNNIDPLRRTSLSYYQTDFKIVRRIKVILSKMSTVSMFEREHSRLCGISFHARQPQPGPSHRLSQPSRQSVMLDY